MPPTSINPAASAHRRLRKLILGLTALLVNAAALAADPDAPSQASAPAASPIARAAPLNWDIGVAPGAAPKKNPPPAPAAPVDASDQGIVPLETITIHGKRDQLVESDRRLRAKIDALPCNGCDGKQFAPTATERAWDLAVKTLAPAEPVPHYPEQLNAEPGDRANVFAQGALQTPLNPGGGPGAPNVGLSAPH